MRIIQVTDDNILFANGKMFFVPCYSEQNGYYSSDIDIYYCDKVVLNLDCSMY